MLTAEHANKERQVLMQGIVTLFKKSEKQLDCSLVTIVADLEFRLLNSGLVKRKGACLVVTNFLVPLFLKLSLRSGYSVLINVPFSVLQILSLYKWKSVTSLKVRALRMGYFKPKATFFLIFSM